MHTLKWIALLGTTAALGGCVGAGTPDDGTGSAARRVHPLESLPTGQIVFEGQTLDLWLAKNDSTRVEGLMFVTEDEIADNQGMLFIFPRENYRGFWMRNTLIPLDIAYARFDGTVVTIHQMPPLTLQTFSSFEPVMFALEMKAGSFERLGLSEGDILDIPDSFRDDVE